MAPTTRQATRTKLKPGTTNVSEAVLDLVIPYIHDVEDRNSVSLVSRKSYETDGITRKRLTVHVRYYPNPASLSKRFPFIQALTLKGAPSYVPDDSGAPWIQQLALEFKCLKELHMRRLVLHDKDLHTLARTRGKDLRSLKISRCNGFSTDGLRHVSNYCNQLRTLCLKYCRYIEGKANIWIHQLALNSMVLERLHLWYTHINAENITLLAKNCCNSLISLKIGACYLSELGDAFRYALRLEQFGGDIYDQSTVDLDGFQFPPSVHSLSIRYLAQTRYSIVLPFLNHIRKLKLVSLGLRYECQCSLFKKCPNLEVLCTDDKCGERGLQVIGKFCKKLRKLNHEGVGVLTHLGVMAVATGCTNLESLKVSLSDISNQALECAGTHLKNLCKFRMDLDKKVGTKDLLLDNGIRAMLMGCSKLESLDITLWDGGLTDVGFEYIGEYGANLRSLTLYKTGMSDIAGLVKLSKGSPRLRKLKLCGFPFSKQAVASSVFNLPSLRYVWGYRSDVTSFALTRPESQLQNIGRSKSKRKSKKVEVDVIA